jgi:hypothetical protein
MPHKIKPRRDEMHVCSGKLEKQTYLGIKPEQGVPSIDKTLAYTGGWYYNGFFEKWLVVCELDGTIT